MNQMNLNQNIEHDWKAFIDTISPSVRSHKADQVASIIRARIAGINVDTLMLNMINKHKASDEEEDDIPSLSADEIEHEFMALLNTINPQYGDTIADEIAEILQMKKMGINVDALLLNVINNHNNVPLTEEVIVISDTEE